LAQKLNLYNQERRALEAQVLDDAMAQVENLGDEPLVFVKGEGWHPGVIGIVASRIKDHTKRPVAVISTENGIGKASARSVVGVDFGAAVVAANQAGLLVAGGGHAMAAGFTVEESKIEALYEFLNERMVPQYDEQQVRSVSFDGYLSVSAITTQLCEELEKLEPYGVGNAEPRFVLTGAKVLHVDTMGESHVRCTLCDSGAGENQSRIRAVAFRCMDTELGSHLLSSKGKNITLLGKVRLNRWQGRYSPEFYIDDMQA
jgi:single-stranded-DNA-specific exonuclease